MNNSSLDFFNMTDCSGGVFTNFPDAWEICKWIRTVELGLTVILNVALIVFLNRMEKRSNLVFFVVNLAISDLAVGVFHVLPLTINHFSNNWALGLLPCKLQFFLSNVSLYVSTYLIVTIGIDRLHSVCQPLSTTRQMPKYRLSMVLTPWILAILISFPILFWTILYHKCGHIICTPDLRGINTIVIVTNAILLLFIPATMIFVCYGCIVFLLCNQLRHDKQNCLGELDLLRSTPRSKTFSKANRRSTIITFVVGLTFILCWLPYIGAGLINQFGHMGPGGWFDILMALSPLNSVLNPVIFLIFNHRMFKTGVAYRYSKTAETRT